MNEEKLKQVRRDIALLQAEETKLLGEKKEGAKWKFGDVDKKLHRVLLKLDGKLMWYNVFGEPCVHHLNHKEGAKLNGYKKTGNIFED
jgi:hypothetical protein